MNEPLMVAYHLKEDLIEIWNQTNKANAEAVLDEWVQQTQTYNLLSKWLPRYEPISHTCLHGMTILFLMVPRRG